MNVCRSGIHRISDTISYPVVCLFYLNKIILRITVFLTLKSMEIDKRSNLEHYIEQAVTLAMYTV